MNTISQRIFGTKAAEGSCQEYVSMVHLFPLFHPFSLLFQPILMDCTPLYPLFIHLNVPPVTNMSWSYFIYAPGSRQGWHLFVLQNPSFIPNLPTGQSAIYRLAWGESFYLYQPLNDVSPHGYSHHYCTTLFIVRSFISSYHSCYCSTFSLATQAFLIRPALIIIALIYLALP